jgi:hypothetical protein
MLPGLETQQLGYAFILVGAGLPLSPPPIKPLVVVLRKLGLPASQLQIRKSTAWREPHTPKVGRR